MLLGHHRLPRRSGLELLCGLPVQPLCFFLRVFYAAVRPAAEASSANALPAEPTAQLALVQEQVKTQIAEMALSERKSAAVGSFRMWFLDLLSRFPASLGEPNGRRGKGDSARAAGGGRGRHSVPLWLHRHRLVYRSGEPWEMIFPPVEIRSHSR